MRNVRVDLMKIRKVERGAKVPTQLNNFQRGAKGEGIIVASRKKTEMYGVVSASKIIGEVVVNQQGEDLGKIYELVIDAKEGRLAYAVLSFGGFMGMGNKLFAVPWRAFEFDKAEKKLILSSRKLSPFKSPFLLFYFTHMGKGGMSIILVMVIKRPETDSQLSTITK